MSPFWFSKFGVLKHPHKTTKLFWPETMRMQMFFGHSQQKSQEKKQLWKLNCEILPLDPENHSAGVGQMQMQWQSFDQKCQPCMTFLTGETLFAKSIGFGRCQRMMSFVPSPKARPSPNKAELQFISFKNILPTRSFSSRLLLLFWLCSHVTFRQTIFPPTFANRKSFAWGKSQARCCHCGSPTPFMHGSHWNNWQIWQRRKTWCWQEFNKGLVGWGTCVHFPHHSHLQSNACNGHHPHGRFDLSWHQWCHFEWTQCFLELHGTRHFQSKWAHLG